MSRVRQIATALVVLAALGGGVAFDLTDDSVNIRASRGEPPLFAARSIFCPPAPVAGESNARIAVVAPSGEALPLGIEEDRFDIGAGRLLMQDNSLGTSLVGYGGEIAGMSLVGFTGKDSGLGAARCSKTASEQWHFAEGSTVLGAEEHLVIYNPFPDEAVVSVSLVTPQGPETTAGLEEGQAVPAGETLTIPLNEFVRQRRFTAATVNVDRGRAVVWRALQLSGHHRLEGVQFSLGAPAPSSEWYFPEGGVGQGLSTRISLYNPSEEEAVATVSLVTDEETLQPPRLVDLAIAPGSLLPLPLDRFVTREDRDLGGAGLVVRTSSGTVVAERSVYYTTPAAAGTASEVGAARTAKSWLMAPTVGAPEIDEVVVMNPGRSAVTVDFRLLSEAGDPLLPGELQNVTLDAGTRRTLSLTKWTAGQSYAVIVEGDGQLVAERFATQGTEVSSAVGLPLVGRRK